jgi:hypothetical protein
VRRRRRRVTAGWHGISNSPRANHHTLLFSGTPHQRRDAKKPPDGSLSTALASPDRAARQSAPANSPGPRACRRRQDWLAHVSAFLLEPAASEWGPTSKSNKNCCATRRSKSTMNVYTQAMSEDKRPANSVVVRSVLPCETCGGVSGA